MWLLCVTDIVAPWKVSIIPNPADPPAESELIREAHAAGLAVVAYTFRSDVHFLHEVSGAETHAHTQAQASSLSCSLMPPSPLLAVCWSVPGLLWCVAGCGTGYRPASCPRRPNTHAVPTHQQAMPQRSTLASFNLALTACSQTSPGKSTHVCVHSCGCTLAAPTPHHWCDHRLSTLTPNHEWQLDTQARCACARPMGGAGGCVPVQAQEDSCAMGSDEARGHTGSAVVRERVQEADCCCQRHEAKVVATNAQHVVHNRG